MFLGLKTIKIQKANATAIRVYVANESTQNLRACLLGGGGPQVGGVTRLSI